ncbi:MAG: putative metal-binding motif-containing protein, partial [Myxococcota bacterium]
TRADVHPGAVEACDGADSDCDGRVDEDGQTLWYGDGDGDGYGDDATATLDCSAEGRVSAGGDCDDGDAAVHPGASDVCGSGLDEDCDGATDEEGLLLWYDDADGDGYGDDGSGALACTGDVTTAGDCDDADVEVNPAGTEVCDGEDDDCDGTADDGLSTTWYIDYDGDGWGADTVYTAANCRQPSGYVAETGDCDDTRAASNPDATEYCNGEDDDCDGEVDEDAAADASTWYADGDGDGYGDPVVSDVECEQPSGYVEDDTDCDDGEASVWPDATERYDGLDNDCDGTVDDNTWIGTGADGALTVTGTTTLDDAWAVSAISGTTITLTDRPTTLAAGDEVLVINLHGSDDAHAAAGTYEFAYVAAVSGTDVTLEDALVLVYGELDNTDLSGQAVQLVRVAQYTDVTVASGGILTAPAWDGATGGVLAFRATGTVSVASGGAVAVDELGYWAGETGSYYNWDAYQGESYAGEGDGDHAAYNESTGEWANNYGGGGAHITGGGGNHGGGATAGDSWTGGSATPPEAGDTYGEPDLSVLFFGSGGGGVWRGSSDPGPGGDGGGILFVAASAIEADGGAALTAIGGTTTHWATGSWTYGAGGGAGGSIWLVADTLTLAADAVDAGGGYGESTHIRAGGDGGYGRVRVDCNAVNGETCGTTAASDALATASWPSPGYESTP